MPLVTFSFDTKAYEASLDEPIEEFIVKLVWPHGEEGIGKLVVEKLRKMTKRELQSLMVSGKMTTLVTKEELQAFQLQG